MNEKYYNIGLMMEQVVLKKRQLAVWSAKPEGKRRSSMIEILNWEINDLMEKIEALV